MRKAVVITVAFLLLLPLAAKAGSWSDRIKLGGDFRQRHEFISDDSAGEDRTRWRVRARLMLSAELDENWSVGVRLATGSDDPTTTNQTMDNGFSTKGINLDLAYFVYHPSAVEGLRITGGKMMMPFVRVQKSQMIWDSDLTPEGISGTLKRKANDNLEIFLGGAFFYIDEREDADDSWMTGVQSVLKIKPKDDMYILAGASYYDYQEIKGIGTFYDGMDGFGNTVDVVGGETFYTMDYNEFELLGEIGIKKDKLSFSFYGDFVKNIAADSLDTGYLFGASVTHGKGKGNFKLSVNYRKIEADAVVGVFTDSDFVDGGTDCKGYVFGIGYGLADRVGLSMYYYLNDKGIEEEVDYSRLQINLSMKF